MSKILRHRLSKILTMVSGNIGDIVCGSGRSGCLGCPNGKQERKRRGLISSHAHYVHAAWPECAKPLSRIYGARRAREIWFLIALASCVDSRSRNSRR